MEILFRDGRSLSVNHEAWKLIDSGGEADVYLAVIKGRKYVVKVYTEKQTELAKPLERIYEISSRLVRIARECRTSGRLPESLVKRGLPVGMGVHKGRAVLVFPYVEDFVTIARLTNNKRSILEYLRNVPLRERVEYAHNVLEALACLEMADIIHVDVTTANAALGVVDGEQRVYLFDIETAAILNSEDYGLVVIPARDTHFLPVDTLPEAGIPMKPPRAEDLPLTLLPTRTKPELLSWALWTPVWYGFQLVAYVYTGFSLFQGLTKLSMRLWKEIVRHEKEREYKIKWPPEAFVELNLVDRKDYWNLVRIWQRLGSNIVNSIYQVFVIDVAEKRLFPTVTLSSIHRTTRL